MFKLVETLLSNVSTDNFTISLYNIISLESCNSSFYQFAVFVNFDRYWISFFFFFFFFLLHLHVIINNIGLKFNHHHTSTTVCHPILTYLLCPRSSSRILFTFASIVESKVTSRERRCRNLWMHE